MFSKGKCSHSMSNTITTLHSIILFIHFKSSDIFDSELQVIQNHSLVLYEMFRKITVDSYLEIKRRFGRFSWYFRRLQQLLTPFNVVCISVDHCMTVMPCNNGGTCSLNQGGGYTCNCTVDYTGTNCENAGEQFCIPYMQNLFVFKGVVTGYPKELHLISCERIISPIERSIRITSMSFLVLQICILIF